MKLLEDEERLLENAGIVDLVLAKVEFGKRWKSCHFLNLLDSVASQVQLNQAFEFRQVECLNQIVAEVQGSQRRELAQSTRVYDPIVLELQNFQISQIFQVLDVPDLIVAKAELSKPRKVIRWRPEAVDLSKLV